MRQAQPLPRPLSLSLPEDILPFPSLFLFENLLVLWKRALFQDEGKRRDGCCWRPWVSL